MEIVGNEVYTLLDHAKQFGPDGEELAVAEVLSKANPMIEDALVIESNSDAGHLTAIRTAIPHGTWRKAYKGVQPVKDGLKQVTESFGTLASDSIVDKLVAEKGGKVAQVRMGQAKSIMTGMAYDMGKTLIEGSQKKEEESFTGLASRYNKVGTFDSEDSSRNVVSAGGNAANAMSSIYFITWDSDKVFMFYPKGSKAGIEHIDYSAGNKCVSVEDGKGGSFPAYHDHFQWQAGLCVADWRYAGRVCNIADTTTGDDLLKALDELCNRVSTDGGGKAILYMNKKVRFKLQQALNKKGNVYYTPEKPGQPLVLTYNGYPVHVCSFISNAEAKVN